MAAKVGNISHDDVHITFEDQQKINRFAKHNARIDELKADLDYKINKVKGIEEAMEELELFDDEELVPYLVGEVFLSHDVPRTRELLLELKDRLEREVKETEKLVGEIAGEMAELKDLLYKRFGNNISLENEE